MKKIKLTLEAKEALDAYLISYGHYTFKEKVSHYLKYSNGWIRKSKPLKDLGLTKFIECLLYGYELAIPSFENKAAKLSFNHRSIKDIVSTKGEIFYEFDKNKFGSLSIEDAKFVRDSLSELIEFYEDKRRKF
jgi:hypothetical protein